MGRREDPVKRRGACRRAQRRRPPRTGLRGPSRALERKGMVPCRGQVCRVYALLAGGHERGPCISGQTLRLFNSTNLVIEYVGRVHPELSCGSRIRRDAQVYRAHIAPRTSTPHPLEGDHNAHRRGTRCPSRPVLPMANCAGGVRR